MRRLPARSSAPRSARDAIIGDIDAGAIDLISIGAARPSARRPSIANAEVDRQRARHRPRSTSATTSQIGTSCAIGHDATIGDGGRDRRSHRDPGRHASSATASAGTARPAARSAMVDRAALPPPPTRRRRAARAFGLRLRDLLLIDPAGRACCRSSRPSTSSTSIDDMHLRPHSTCSYHWYLPLLAWPTAMLMIFRHRRPHRASCAGWCCRRSTLGHLLDLLRLLPAQVDRRARDRGHARHAVLALRHDLHAGLVPADGRADRQRRRDLDEPRRPLRSRRRSGEKNFIADEVVFGDEESAAAGCISSRSRTGARVFVGNDARRAARRRDPGGRAHRHQVEAAGNDMMAPGETWFGSPPIKLPTRQKVDHRPELDLRAGPRPRFGRGVFEALHTSFPPMLFITFAIIADRQLSSTRRSWTGDWHGAVVSFVGRGHRHRGGADAHRRRGEMAD